MTRTQQESNTGFDTGLGSTSHNDQRVNSLAHSKSLLKQTEIVSL